MAISRGEVDSLIRFSVVNAWDRASQSKLRPKVEALLSQIIQVCPPPLSDTFLEELCDEMERLGVTTTPFLTADLLRRLKTFPDKPFLIVIANALRDDSRFNSQIWPRAQRLQAFYERVMDLFSAHTPCKDATRELMIDLLHGQFFFSPGVGDGEPLYLFRSVETDCIKLLSEHHANQLAPLLLHTDLKERQRGFLILTDWIRYHFHKGEISKRLAEFLNDQSARSHCLARVFFRQDLEFRLPVTLPTILQAPAELPPPYMPSYAQTTLTAQEIGRYNGAISTLHDLIHDSRHPIALETCQTLEDVFPVRLALMRDATLKKASQLAGTIPLHPLHHRAIEMAAEIMRQCSELPDSEFAASLDAFDSRLSECGILFDSDEYGHIPDYFGELLKSEKQNQIREYFGVLLKPDSFYHPFKLVCWKLQERPLSCIDDESIERLLQAAETVPLFSLLTPRRIAYLLWPAFNTSPKDWSEAYATLVDHINVALTRWKIESYPHDLTSQLRWLHECWQQDTLCPLPREVYMPCNLSGLRIDDPNYFRNTLSWLNTTRDRGWWVLPNDMTLTDISNDKNFVEQMLSLCAYPQRLRELDKIWDSFTQDPSVFPMLFRVLQLNKPEHIQTLRDFFPKIPPGQVKNCLGGYEPVHPVFLKALDLTRVDQLEAVLERFSPELFDREFFQKYDALYALLPNPADRIKASVGTLKLRMYRALCLALPDSAVNSRVKTLFSSHDKQTIAEQIYEVKKILGAITLFAKENQLTPSAAAIRLSESSTLDVLIKLWESKNSAHLVLRELLEDVDSLINMNQVLLAMQESRKADETESYDESHSPRNC